MQLVSFSPLRSLGIPNIKYIKPEAIFKEKKDVLNADWVLYPEYWQVDFLVYAWKKKIFPSINSYHLGHDKVVMSRSLQAVVPEHVPETLVAANLPGIKERILENFRYPFVAKEIRSSMGQGVHLVTGGRELNDYLSHNETVYIQEYLPIDRDLRVVFVGEKVVSAYWRVGQGQFKNNIAQGAVIDFAGVPPQALKLVEKLALILGINHAGFDLAVVDGHFYFFEFNIMFGNEALLQAGVSLGVVITEYLFQEEEPEPVPPKPLFPQAS